MSYLKETILIPAGTIMAGIIIGLVILPAYFTRSFTGNLSSTDISNLASILSLVAVAYVCITFFIQRRYGLGIGILFFLIWNSIMAIIGPRELTTGSQSNTTVFIFDTWFPLWKNLAVIPIVSTIGGVLAYISEQIIRKFKDTPTRRTVLHRLTGLGIILWIVTLIVAFSLAISGQNETFEAVELAISFITVLLVISLF